VWRQATMALSSATNRGSKGGRGGAGQIPKPRGRGLGGGANDGFRMLHGPVDKAAIALGGTRVRYAVAEEDEEEQQEDGPSPPTRSLAASAKAGRRPPKPAVTSKGRGRGKDGGRRIQRPKSAPRARKAAGGSGVPTVLKGAALDHSLLPPGAERAISAAVAAVPTAVPEQEEGGAAAEEPSSSWSDEAVVELKREHKAKVESLMRSIHKLQGSVKDLRRADKVREPCYCSHM
jgi:hypothetical protein